MLLADVRAIEQRAPFRRMPTRGGGMLSVAMTNCGRIGWVSDRAGYHYMPVDPLTGRPWPPMPESFAALAARAAISCFYAPFAADACLVNRYAAGTRLSLHQDRDELDFSVPIVSVSLGLPATFLFGGLQRRDPAQRFRLRHGDVVVWGGASRLAFHGVAALPPGDHPAAGPHRINLTFRKASESGSGAVVRSTRSRDGPGGSRAAPSPSFDNPR